MQTNLVLWERIIYVFHAIISVLGLVAPFLVSWYLIVPVYLLILLQFIIFGRCLLNDVHGLYDDGEETIFSTMLDKMNLKVNKKRLYFFVRNIMYLTLSSIAIIWQVILGYSPLLF